MKTLAALALTLVMTALAAATPLHDAVEKNDLAAIFALLGAGADPNAKDGTYGWSPLHWVAYRGDAEAIARPARRRCQLGREGRYGKDPSLVG